VRTPAPWVCTHYAPSWSSWTWCFCKWRCHWSLVKLQGRVQLERAFGGSFGRLYLWVINRINNPQNNTTALQASTRHTRNAHALRCTFFCFSKSIISLALRCQRKDVKMIRCNSWNNLCVHLHVAQRGNCLASMRTSSAVTWLENMQTNNYR